MSCGRVDKKKTGGVPVVFSYVAMFLAAKTYVRLCQGYFALVQFPTLPD